MNVNISAKQELAGEAQGSFHLAQLLCHRACLEAGLKERSDETLNVTISAEVVKQRVFEDQRRAFFEIARTFASGLRVRREGRGPYLHMLYWLATSNEWSIQLDQAMAQHPEHKASVGQVVEKGFLSSFLEQNPHLQSVLHFDRNTRVLSVEDPKFVYFLRNLAWKKFARQVGFVSIDFLSKYDYALSFAGPNRIEAECIRDGLVARDISVFYDKDEQHRILAENIEDYLGPIYRSEAEFVVALLSKDYPNRVWTVFESQQFKDRFGDNRVIPIWFSDSAPGAFDESARVGGIRFDVDGDQQKQCADIVEQLSRKLLDFRTSLATDGRESLPE